MPLVIECPNPACRNRASVPESFSGKSVRCKKCQTPFEARSTHGWDSTETRGSRPASAGEPFPTLPAEFGRYRVLKKLGQGGMGAVYLAEDTQLSRRVALKLPSFEAGETQRRERFVREAKAAAGLMHPSICPVFDAGTLDGKLFISMGYIEGKPLEDLWDPDRPMDPRQAAGLIGKIALALQEAHDQGIVHRDLKPANVMVNARGEPVVMDFGLAKRVSEVDSEEAKLTRDGALLGTPSYMAPEQVKGDLDQIGPATDIYALGVMLFEALTGRTPYQGTLGVVMGRILTAPVPSVAEFRAEVDPRLDAICQKAMAKDPRARFSSMAELAEALDEVQQPIAPQPRTPPPSQFAEMTATRARPGSQTKKPRSWRPVALAAGVLGLGLLAVVLMSLKTRYGEVVLEIDEAQAKVEVKVDGERIEIAGLDKPLSLKPGEHGLTVTAPDFETLTRQFTVKQGERQVVKIALKPLARPAPAQAGVVKTVNRKPSELVGTWKIEGNELVQPNRDRAWIHFGDSSWSDYDFTFESKTASHAGAPFFGPVVRYRVAPSEADFHVVSLGHGGDGSFHRTNISKNNTWKRIGDHVPTRFATDRWIKTRIRVRGATLQCFVEDALVFDYRDPNYERGHVGLGTWDTSIRFRNIQVAAPDGSLLWDGLPDVPAVVPAPNAPVQDRRTARRERGDWKIEGRELVQTQPGLAAVLFGDKKWTDYDFSFETMTEGAPDQRVDGGVAVFRAQDFGNLHSLVVGAYRGTFMEVCRWQNSEWHRDVNPLGKAFHAGAWHRVLVKVRGDRFICQVDDETLFDYRDNRFPQGGVGLRTWAPTVRFRNIKVVDPSGTVLWDGLPEIPPDAFDRKPTLVEGGDWKIEGRDLVQAKPENAKLFFGDTSWTDYDFTFLARTDAAPGSGAMGNRVLFRATSPENLHRISVGAGGGTIDEISRFDNGAINRDRPTVKSQFQPGTWYWFLVRVRGETIQCEINGRPVFDYQDPLHPRGQVGLTTWNAACRWRDIRVTAPDGTVLWEGLPDLVAAASVPKAVQPPAPSAPAASGSFQSLFNGKDLSGWKVDGGSPTQWTIQDGAIVANSANYVTRNYLLSEADYADFILRFEFQVGDDQAHGGVALRAIPGEQVPRAGKVLFDHPMIKLTHPDRDVRDGTGAAHWLRGSEPNTLTVSPPKVVVGQWHKAEVVVRGEACVIAFDGQPLEEIRTDPTAAAVGDFVPGLKRSKGKIGFQINRGTMRYRKIEIQKLPPAADDPLREKSVWINVPGQPSQIFTILERKGDTFKAHFKIGQGIEREVTGTVKNGTVSWRARDVKAIRGPAGGDNTGKWVQDKEGVRLEFEWTSGDAQGRFVLRLKSSP